MPPARSVKSTPPRPRRPTSPTSNRRTRPSSGECSAARVADLPLALWPCAQRVSQWQRHEGTRFLGIEREASYVPIARARIKHWATRLRGCTAESARARRADKA